MGSLNFPTIDALIAQFEGANTPGTLAQVNNNPGNLVYGSFAVGEGATGSNQGFAVFPSAAAGAEAEDALVSSLAAQGDTVGQLISTWAPGTAPGNTPQATANYQNYVANSLGVNPNTPVSQAEQNAQASPTASSQTALSRFGSWLTSGWPFNSGGSGGSGSGLLSGLTWITSPTRLGSLIIGILALIAAIYLFKPVQQAANTTIRIGRRAVTAIGS